MAAEANDNEIHKEKFMSFISEKYFKEDSKRTTSSVIFRDEGEKFRKYLADKEGSLTKEEAARIKRRRICVQFQEGKSVLAIQLEKGKAENKKLVTLPVVYVEDFYSIINKIHNDIVGHSGIFDLII